MTVAAGGSGRYGRMVSSSAAPGCSNGYATIWCGCSSGRRRAEGEVCPEKNHLKNAQYVDQIMALDWGYATTLTKHTKHHANLNFSL